MEAISEPRGIHRRIDFTVTESLRIRFWNKVSKAGPDECWPWIGAPRNGYGAIRHERHILGTHVVAYRIAKGEVPNGMLVTHTCDNRLCCNPNHLEAGTHKKNVLDMHARRAVNWARGEASYNAVLTDDIVLLIKALRVVFGHGGRRIATRLHLQEETVRDVVEKQSWTHIPWPSKEEAEQLLAESGILAEVPS